MCVCGFRSTQTFPEALAALCAKEFLKALELLRPQQMPVALLLTDFSTF